MWPWRRDLAALPKPGDVIAGKYRVESVLGVGGMGVVVAARHAKLDELVALKVLRPQVLRSREDIGRFLREGRACSKLKSEHVVRILDLGELDGDVPYLVMEHLEGRDLAAVLRDQGTFPVALAVESVLEACEAVAEAHALGIVHRDLKPANLFLADRADGKPVVKVLDFGISKLLDDAADMSLTTTRALMGSPLYMAPEMMRSAKVADARSDVWAIGVILYELLSGTTPFHGQTVTELCINVLEQTPRSLAHFRTDVPPGLDAVILRCLAKNPDDRHPSIVDLAAALAPFAEGGRHALETIERVVRAAEQRQRAKSSTSSPSLEDALAETTAATGDETLRAWGTTSGAPRKRKVSLVRVTAAVVAAGVVAGALFVFTRKTDPGQASPRPTMAAARSASTSSVSTEPTTSASAEVAPAPSPSEKPASGSPAPPSSKPTAPTKPKPGGGKPTKTSPYFDDPN